jgi:hypothetical protein
MVVQCVLSRTRVTSRQFSGAVSSRRGLAPRTVRKAAWATGLYTVHMASAYAAFAVLGTAVLAADGPSWLGWLGVGLGVGCLAGFVGTRFAGPFNPPILAHTYTAVLGVWLLTQTSGL